MSDWLDRVLGYLPSKERLTVSQFSEKYRWLFNEGGGHVGKWDNSKVPYLNEPMDELDNFDVQTVVIAAPGQSGKALALDTPIPTPGGWTTMGELCVGSEVFSEDGSVCRVSFVTPVMNDHKCYRVGFSDGESIVADAEHLWKVETHARPRRMDGTSYHVWDRKKVLNTEEIFKKHRHESEGMNRYAVRNAKSLELPDVELPIPPYFLGVWLGDGNSNRADFTLHESDEEILEYIRSDGLFSYLHKTSRNGVMRGAVFSSPKTDGICSRGHDLSAVGVYSTGSCKKCSHQRYRLNRKGEARDPVVGGIEILRSTMRSLGLIGNKHIPPAYLRSGYSQRLALLQGLMDTDGTIGKNCRRASFCGTDRGLADGVFELVVSLGMKPTIRTRIPTTIYKGNRVEGARAYYVDFTTLDEVPVFRLARKLARQKSTKSRRNGEVHRRRITSVAEVPSVPVRCIQVDHPSHMYLAGKSMIPTHNTEIGQNWFMRSVWGSPGNFLWFMQTDDSLEAFVKARINPMVKKHPFMADALGKTSKDDSLHFKNFGAMHIEFLSATYSNLINKSAPRVMADEIDAYPESLGNVKPLLDIRRQTFGRESKLLITSHPDRARGLNPDKDWSDGVMGVYADSDRRVWYWKCPHCGAWSSPCPLADRYMCLDYPADGTLDEVQDQACLVCPVNGCAINDAERLAMNKTGRWIGLGQKISIEGVVTGERLKRTTAGFWAVGAMSPFVLGGIGALARAKAKAEREFEVSGDDKTLREVMTKQFGFPYTPPRQIGSVTANDLAARAEHTIQLGVVPRGVRFLTAAVDCQMGYFDCLVRGWGVGGESWVVDRFRVAGDPATSHEDWDKLINLLVKRVYDLQDFPGKGMTIRGIGYDSGGQPGVTARAYDAWSRWRDKGLVRNYGIINGREAWSVLPTKGMSAAATKRLSVNYPDTSAVKGKGASKGTVPVAMFNPGQFKDDLNGQIQRAEEGAWYVHFPAELRSQNPPHPWFEQLVSEARDIKGKWEKINKAARNEALDLMVMNHVIAHLHGLTQIKWDRPPSWASEWEQNGSLVSVERIEEIVQDRPAAGAPRSNPIHDVGVKIVVQQPKNKRSFIDSLA